MTSVPNIGPREIRKRQAFGTAFLIAAVVLDVALVRYQAPRWSRLMLFPPLWVAALGLIQASQKTCVALAARNARNMDTGIEPIEDEVTCAIVRRQAYRVHRYAWMAAAVATLLALL